MTDTLCPHDYVPTIDAPASGPSHGATASYRVRQRSDDPWFVGTHDAQDVRTYWLDERTGKWIDAVAPDLARELASRKGLSGVREEYSPVVVLAGRIGALTGAGFFLIFGGIASLVATASHRGVPAALGAALLACGATLIATMLVAYQALNARIDQRHAASE